MNPPNISRTRLDIGGISALSTIEIKRMLKDLYDTLDQIKESINDHSDQIKQLYNDRSKAVGTSRKDISTTDLRS